MKKHIENDYFPTPPPDEVKVSVFEHKITGKQKFRVEAGSFKRDFDSKEEAFKFLDAVSKREQNKNNSR